MTVITEGCLCSAAVTGEVEVDVTEIVSEEVECEPFPIFTKSKIQLLQGKIKTRSVSMKTV